MSDAAQVRGLLLAGGRSRRMGQDKRLLSIDGEPLIVRVHRAFSEAFGAPWVLVREEADAQLLRPLLGEGATFLLDAEPSAGPLSAVADALDQLDRGCAFLLATDLPGVSSQFLRRFDALRRGLPTAPDALIATTAGRLQVMSAFYRPRIAAALRDSVRWGQHCMVQSIRQASIDVHYLSEEEVAELGGEAPFENLNTPADHARYLETRVHAG